MSDEGDVQPKAERAYAVLMAALDTPFIYLGVYLVRRYAGGARGHGDGALNLSWGFKSAP